jgi:hypothetical protein
MTIQSLAGDSKPGICLAPVIPTARRSAPKPKGLEDSAQGFNL